ncbi:hypothetical protein HG530_012692 [Fusarium avenaceum]|nr:hypothetical protein HG530_012692 [Fusarium avenaceum]
MRAPNSRKTDRAVTIPIERPFWLRRKHVESVTATRDSECSTSIIASALKVTQPVDLCLALWIFGQHTLVVHDFGNGSLSVDDLFSLWRSRTALAPASPSPAASATASRRVGLIGRN